MAEHHTNTSGEALPGPRAGLSTAPGRRTSRRVHVSNALAGWVIRLAGLGTIVAVFLVCVFLVLVAVPLFRSGRLELTAWGAQEKKDTAAPAAAILDDAGRLAWVLDGKGTWTLYRLDRCQVISEGSAVGETAPTAVGGDAAAGQLILGFADGTIRLGQLTFSSQIREEASVPQEARKLAVGEWEIWNGALIERVSEDQFRVQEARWELEEPVVLEAGVPIRRVDVSIQSSGSVVAALTDSGRLHVDQVIRRRNLLTGRITSTLRGGKLELGAEAARSAIWLGLSGLGDQVYVAFEDGQLWRIDTRNVEQPVLTEKADVIAEVGERLTRVIFLTGRAAIAAGDSLGRLSVWSLVRQEGADTADGHVLTKIRELPRGPGAVAALSSSRRTRLVAAGYADGSVQLFHTTSQRHIARSHVRNTEESSDQVALALSARDEVLLWISGNSGLAVWQVQAGHPEVSLRSMFWPVWYEGYPGPAHVWQSSGATDDFEPKYGLVPLIFGTLKATFYSMLFGAPLALLAAVYTSEVMHPRWRARIKPVVETMASLPSVVLGFLAALVIAPFVEKIVPQVLTALVTVPWTVLLGGYLWQLLPHKQATSWRRWRITLVAAGAGGGLGLAWVLGPWVEKFLFAGDIKAWLTGRRGGPMGGWVLLVLPVCALAAAWVGGRLINPWVRNRTGSWSYAKLAWLDLGKFLLLSSGTVVAAGVAGWGLSCLGDPRGGVLATYVQRNALVVGFVMGFAIIPIIFTIAEDALSAVPEHLRAGSLGAGATPWQTAVRIVIPTAMSGLFSALMIGLGRAVGETMIVLMAAGNTPIMEWNIFNGFRTLSANIAVELPEAVRDSTHYRMLFFSALVLFAITFVINTVAEMVRLRFRRKAYEL